MPKEKCQKKQQGSFKNNADISALSADELLG